LVQYSSVSFGIHWNHWMIDCRSVNDVTICEWWEVEVIVPRLGDSRLAERPHIDVGQRCEPQALSKTKAMTYSWPAILQNKQVFMSTCWKRQTKRNRVPDWPGKKGSPLKMI
jgi:hypothetical protein